MVSLVVTVSVEPDMPRGEVQARTSLRNLDGLGRLQGLCEQFGIPPTYLLAFPVANRKIPRDVAKVLNSDRCEVGAALLPWVTPPFDVLEDRLVAVSPHQAPASMVQAKLEHLTDAIEETFGRRPRTHRAAHGGLNGAGLQALERLGYRVDASVTPFVDGSPEGVDWRGAPEAPYFPDRQDPARRGASPVLEVPQTSGWDRDIPSALARGAACSPRLRRLLSNDLLPVTRLTALDPRHADAAAMRRLSQTRVERGLPVLQVLLRSNELAPGESAATPGAAEAEETYAVLEGFLRFAVDELRATPRTLSGFAQHYLDETGCV